MPTIRERSISVIYCDDVRHEASGKLTVVGMHQEGTPVHVPESGALALLKFCVIGTFRTPIDRPLSALACELRFNDTVLHRVELPSDALRLPGPNHPGQRTHVAQLMMEFGNLALPGAGTLRFVAIADEGEIYEGPGLHFVQGRRVAQQDQSDNAQP